MQMSDKATRLEAYEKLEEELDKVVVQAAALPGRDSIAVCCTTVCIKFTWIF